MTPQGSGSAGVNHLISYGQSLSYGVLTGPVISTTQRFDSLMFNGGVRASDGGTSVYGDRQELVPLIEANSTVGGAGGRGETPLSGATEMLKELGSSLQYLASAPGQNGSTIAILSKPGEYYTRLLDDVQQGWRRAKQAKKSHKVRAFFWMQGESDGANNAYAANLNTLRNDLDADIKALTGQPDDVWCISYQVPRQKIGLAHLEAQETYSLIRVAMPIYHLATVADGVHLTPQASKIAGAYFGLAYKRIIEDGNTAWKPLMVTSASVSGSNIDLTYNVPMGELAFDTTIVAEQTNKGFRLVDSGGAALTISSVTITGTNKVRIVAAASVPAGAKVYYGFDNPAGNDIGGVKGNLRDTQGASIVFDGGGLNYPLHNWALHQVVQLP